jgi:hypothetical protein
MKASTLVNCRDYADVFNPDDVNHLLWSVILNLSDEYAARWYGCSRCRFWVKPTDERDNIEYGLVRDDEALPQGVLHIANLVSIDGGMDVGTQVDARVVGFEEIATTKRMLRPAS